MPQSPRNPPIVQPPIRLAVCVSGEGTTLQNLIDQIRARRLRAEIVQVVASRPRIGAIPRAEAAGIPLALANRNARSRTEFSASVFEPIRHSQADLVILGGFLSLLNIPPEYKGRVLNIHPALVPAFCGEGYYGSKVHRAVLDSGVKVSGCTVHIVNGVLDGGPILLQTAVPVLNEDTVETLSARILREEHLTYWRAVDLLLSGQCEIHGRRIVLTQKP